MNPLQYLGQLSSLLRVPLMVMLLMAVASIVLSERVLTRLSQNQETYLTALASSYLDGIAASVSPSVVHQDSWEIFDILTRMKPQKATIYAQETVVTDAKNIVLASDNPDVHPTLGQMDPKFGMEFEEEMRLDTVSQLAFAARSIRHNEEIIGKVYVVFDASSLLKERREVLRTLILTNIGLAVLLAAIGFFVVRRMVLPMQILERHLLKAASGGLEFISDVEYPKANREAKRIFGAFNQLVGAEKEREGLVDRLTKEERLASLGRIASSMAHEINNPLGGLLNAADTLKKHGHQEKVRLETVDLIKRGLLGIRDVVQAALVTYRPQRSSRVFTLKDLTDISLLLRSDLGSRAQELKILPVPFDKVFDDLPAGPIRQAIMNLVLNASNASPHGCEIVLSISQSKEGTHLEVKDIAEGLPDDAGEILTAPLKSGIPDGMSGLGLWVVRQIADELGATLSVKPNIPKGTIIAIDIPRRSGEMIHAAA